MYKQCHLMPSTLYFERFYFIIIPQIRVSIHYKCVNLLILLTGTYFPLTL